MHQAATILRVLADLAVMAKVAPDIESAQGLIAAKFREHAFGDATAAGLAFPLEASARSECPSCPLRQPGARAALDGIAGAFLQLSEHFDLLAEAPPAPIASAPAQERAAAQLPAAG